MKHGKEHSRLSVLFREHVGQTKVVMRLIEERLKKGVALYSSYFKAANEQVYSRYSIGELETIADYHCRMRDV
jgi:hypothetical protein